MALVRKMTYKLRHPLGLRHPVPKHASCFLMNVCVCSLPLAIYIYIYIHVHTYMWGSCPGTSSGLRCRSAPLESRYKSMCVNACIYAYVCACMCMCMCMRISGSHHGTWCGPSLPKCACCVPTFEWFQLITLTYIYVHEVCTRICNMYVHTCVCKCACVCVCLCIYVCICNLPHAINTGKHINFTSIRLFLHGTVSVCAQVRAWVSHNYWQH